MATNTQTNPQPESNLQTGGSSNFLKTIQDKLLGQSGVVSSTTSELEGRLNNAISGVETATEAGAAKIESEFGRELDFRKGVAGQAVTAGRAAGSGGVLNLSALRALTETTDKSLKDLEQRKQELILQNNATGAAKVAELEFSAIEFQQKAQQQTFSNLLGMANFGIQSAQEKRLSEQQTFAEQQSINNIALEFGLDPTGKTFNEITQEAMVFASDDRKNKLAREAAQTNLINAQTADILSGIEDPESINITPAIRSKLALRWNTLTQNGTTTPQQGSIQDVELANIIASFSTTKQKNDFFEEVALQAKQSAQEIVDSRTKKPESRKSALERGLPGAAARFGKGFIRATGGLSDFLAGREQGTVFKELGFN